MHIQDSINVTNRLVRCHSKEVRKVWYLACTSPTLSPPLHPPKHHLEWQYQKHAHTYKLRHAHTNVHFLSSDKAVATRRVRYSGLYIILWNAFEEWSFPAQTSLRYTGILLLTYEASNLWNLSSFRWNLNLLFFHCLGRPSVDAVPTTYVVTVSSVLVEVQCMVFRMYEFSESVSHIRLT